ncbi:MAG TPA: TerC family protein [Patescibacteria group bacterium]|nr:TerC family protein [Patescibacteria group bacterium]
MDTSALVDNLAALGGQPLWVWGVFFAVFLGVLVFDLNVINKKDHVFGAKESLRLSAIYGLIALAFGGWIFMLDSGGPEKAGLFITGYLVELSLSMDNIFVISLVLSYFAVPKQFQHRVLFWGIMGVIVMRGIMIGAGSAIVQRFEWVLLIFALFLVYTGAKMLFMDDGDEEQDLSNNKVVKFFRKHLRLTEDFHGHHFLVREKSPKTGKMVLFATPLFLALCVIEVVDVIFAVDSIPAILAITQDPFLVYTSNLFAIMGLRALYFALSAMLDRFQYLKYALSLVLVFIGLKVLIGKGPEEIAAWISPHNPDLAATIGGYAFHMPPWVSLLLTVGTLIAGGVFSFIKTEAAARAEKKAAKKK